jgi:cyclohexadieny/prephenate dehydrogenase
MPFRKVAIIGLGLQGGSIGLALREHAPAIATTGYDRNPTPAPAPPSAVWSAMWRTPRRRRSSADLVIFCVPPSPWAMPRANAPRRWPRCGDLRCRLQQGQHCAGAERSAAHPHHHPRPPRRGHRALRARRGLCQPVQGRWCIITPPEDTDAAKVERLSTLWQAIGAKVEIMDAAHHDLVLAITSHLPHLIAYTIVGTADDLQEVTQSEVIKYSAGGFRDFTRIAASDPTMWRDVFLSNRDAVLAMLQVFTEDLTELQKAIRLGDGEKLFDHFTRTRAIRRSIIEQGQDDATPNFGRQG